MLVLVVGVLAKKNVSFIVDAGELQMQCLVFLFDYR
jgi:hypothetical protein